MFGKNKWKRVSESLAAEKYLYTPEQCRLKIKGLIEKYERARKNTWAMMGLNRSPG